MKNMIKYDCQQDSQKSMNKNNKKKICIEAIDDGLIFMIFLH